MGNKVGPLGQGSGTQEAIARIVADSHHESADCPYTTGSGRGTTKGYKKPVRKDKRGQAS